MNQDPTISITCDHLIVVSDEGTQRAPAEPEAVLLQPPRRDTMRTLNWFERHQARMRAVPPWLRFVLVVPFLLAGLGLGASWWVSYAGPYRWLAEWQISFLGAYYPMPTGMATLVIGILPAALPLFVLAFLLGLCFSGRVTTDDPE
jgi:hypothetical protein